MTLYKPFVKEESCEKIKNSLWAEIHPNSALNHLINQSEHNAHVCTLKRIMEIIYS